MTGFGRSDEYNAGHAMGRTFDDGTGARLLRPENRVPFVDTKDKDAVAKIRDALIHVGVMQAGEDAKSTVDLDTVNEPVEDAAEKE